MIADSKFSGKVSLVVASFNHATFLTSRIDSLLLQTYSDIDILVIDDKSTDNSIEVLRRYDLNPKIKLLQRELNGGWVVVSNQGLELTSGEFVLFANCDDECEPLLVERLVSALRLNPSAGVAFSRSLLIDENSNIIGDDFLIREASFLKRCAEDSLLSGEEMAKFLLHSCVIPNLSAALFRRECLVKIGNFSSEYKVCSDWDLFFRMAERYDFAYVSDPLNRFRQHSKTIRSVTKEKVIYEEYFRLLLSKISHINLSAFEQAKYRTRVMYLWMVHLFSFSFNGIFNSPYHLKKICQYDFISLIFLFPAAIYRIFELIAKLISKFHSKKF
jgi:glycosyltransferase involved in cell wall biosynthesis